MSTIKESNKYEIMDTGEYINAVDYIEQTYPETAKEFKKIQQEQYEEYPPAHQPHNLYCSLPANRYGKEYSIKHFFVRNKIIASVSDMVVAFIPEGIKSNGSLDTIKQAKKQDKKVKIIY